ncbi:Laccase [uncultured archaeon]|nr:Laccase [uncultured archaeon]
MNLKKYKAKRTIHAINVFIVILLTAGILFSIFVLNVSSSIASTASSGTGTAVAAAGTPTGGNTNTLMPTSAHTTKAQRDFAAALLIKARSASLTTGTAAPAPAGVNVPGGTADYFGTIANYANSPLPTVDPLTGNIYGGIPKFVDSLPGLGPGGANNLGQYIPVAVPDTCPAGLQGPVSDCYEIHLVQYTEKMSSNLPPTTLRGYVQYHWGTNTPFDNPHSLGPVIVAQKDTPVRVKFVNTLNTTGAGGNLFLPVDTTVMGAGNYTVKWNAAVKDSTGTPVSIANTSGMFAQNRATLHLHGGNTPWISDGTEHQWTTPAGETTTYPEGVSVKNVPDMDSGVEPQGTLTFYYTNNQSARLMFYHDHAYGITRLNVYAGEAAPYIVQDPAEQALINGGTFTKADGTTFTATAGTIPDANHTIPLVIEDKTFVDANAIPKEDPTWNWGTTPPIPNTGDLWFPHVYMPNQNPALALAGGINPNGRWDYGMWVWPFIIPSNGPVANPLYQPNPGLPNYAPWENSVNPGTPNPSIVPEAFMDTPVVNGNVYPNLTVGTQAYRFRILNAANDRMFNLQLYYASTASPYVVFNNTGTNGFGASASVTVNATGSITGINLTSGGANYSMAPSIYILDAPGHVITPVTTTGSVASIVIDTAGSNYTNPVVTITNATGDTTGCCATAQATLGTYPTLGIYSISVTNAGSGYTLPPNVTITDTSPGTGSGATAHAVLATTGTGFSQATATATIDPLTGMVTGVTLGGSGSGYSVPTICQGAAIPSNLCTEVSMVPAAVGAANFPASWLINTGGAGYAPDILDNRVGGIPNPAAYGPEMIQIGNEGGFMPNPYNVPNRPVGYNPFRKTIVITNVQERALYLGPAERADVIVNFTGLPSGSTLMLYNDAPAPMPAFDLRYDYYTSDPDQVTSGGAPSTVPGYGPNTRTVMQIKVNSAVNIPGTPAFNAADLATALPAAYGATQPAPIVPQADYGAAFGKTYNTSYAKIMDLSQFMPGPITDLSLMNGGSNYTSAPTVTITNATGDTTGCCATATAAISNVVQSVTVTKSGSGYLVAPTVVFSGGGGCCTTATANIAGSVASITVTAAGGGYTSAPTVTLSAPQLAGGIQATATASINNKGQVSSVKVTNAGSGYTAAPTMTFSGGGGTGAAAVATLTSLGVYSVTVTSGGYGYTTAPAVSFSGGGGSNAAATATITGAVISLNLTNPGSNYTMTPTVTISGGNGTGATAIAIMGIEYTNKGIIEDFDTDYGRMNAMLGVEIGQRVNLTPLMQTSIPYYDIDPPTELIKNSNSAVRIGTMADGTQIWKVTHNGVDTHAIHVHMFNVQLINRVAWDGTIEAPDPNEEGWKDTIRMNPLEDAYIALRPIKPPVPWDLPNEIRPLDVTAPVSMAMSPLQFHNTDPMNQPATVLNHMINYGWEYVWHCHLLGHEENIMMRPMLFVPAPNAPNTLTTTVVGTGSKTAVNLSWIDNSTSETTWTIQRATGTGPWATIAAVPSRTGPGVGTTVTYTDASVVTKTLYNYRVLATDVAGDTTVYAAPITGYPTLSVDSAPSNNATAQT